MAEYSLETFAAAVRGSWSRETSDFPDLWRPEHAEIGQAAVTAVLLHDAFGGKIIKCYALSPIASGIGSHPHYYNELPQNTAGVVSVNPEPLHPELQVYEMTGVQYNSGTSDVDFYGADFRDFHECHDYHIVSPGLECDPFRADTFNRYKLLRNSVKIALGISKRVRFPYQFSEKTDRERLARLRMEIEQKNRKW